jgi:hypothetical protein
MMANQGTTSVWIQLYIGGEKNGSVFGIYDFAGNVDQLREALKKKCQPKLEHCDGNMLTVYPAGTSVPVSEGTEPIDPSDNVPRNTSSRNPLIVIGPPRDERKPGKLMPPFLVP